VRSSANVSNGAKTGWSNFFHGLFLAVFVLAFPWLIREIPFASLAALLVFTGFRLSSPKEFAKTMDLGHEQLILFVITIIGVLATDLLVGVLIGILAKIIIHLAWGVKLSNLIRISFEIEESTPESYLIRIHGSAIFSNFIGLKSAVTEIPAGKKVTFDVSDAYLIDHTVMEFIDHFRHDYQDRGGDCEILGLERLKSHAKNPLGTHRFMG
jgi:MFS superfamily sulfate permease-like transporter